MLCHRLMRNRPNQVHCSVGEQIGKHQQILTYIHMRCHRLTFKGRNTCTEHIAAIILAVDVLVVGRFPGGYVDCWRPTVSRLGVGDLQW